MNEYIESCQQEKRTYDEEGVREAVRLFLKSIGEDPEREGLVETPDRIARACRELFAGVRASPAAFPWRGPCGLHSRQGWGDGAEQARPTG